VRLYGDPLVVDAVGAPERHTATAWSM
jgi:hypothetical protein